MTRRDVVIHKVVATEGSSKFTRNLMGFGVIPSSG